MGRTGVGVCRLAWMGIAAALAVGACRAGSAMAQAKGAPAGAPDKDSSYIAADGTAHVTRVVPVPQTISPEAQKMVGMPATDSAGQDDLAKRRADTDAWQNRAGEESKAIYPVHVSEAKMAGVPVRVIVPLEIPEAKRSRVLINLHGGGFNSDSGSLTESIPIANLTQTKVVAVLYRLAPEHAFPAGLEDAVAVYRELLKTYKPENIAIYGTSAGAVLTAEVASKLTQLHLPLPGALGIFSGMGDFSRHGDSEAMYALNGLSGHLEPPKAPGRDPYVGETSRTDPVLSPIFADLTGMPPTLFITSGRDLLLSGTSNLHRAFLRAGADARLVVFDGLPHAFWNNPHLPESREADGLMAAFFNRQLGRPR